jgi:hypothetical protein
MVTKRRTFRVGDLRIGTGRKHMVHSGLALDHRFYEGLTGSRHDWDQPVYRPVQSCDWRAIQAHFLRLSKGERVIRFGGAVSDAFIQTYCKRAEASDRIAFGCIDDGQVCGFAELVPAEPPDAPEAEIAISVEAGTARDMIGEALLRMAMEAACDRLIKEVVVQVHSEEHALPTLLATLGASLDPSHECMRVPVGLGLFRLMGRDQRRSAHQKQSL